jgi:hypothetical protein
MKNLLLCITFLCLLAVGTVPAHAKKKLVHADATITAVSDNSISVKTGHAAHTYKITSQTLIHVDGTKATAKDLKKGMHAAVTASQLDASVASAVDASNGS